MVRTKEKCPICGQLISKSNYNRHIKRHETNPSSFNIPKYRLDHTGLVCQYCGKEYKNTNSLCNHERLCKDNPDRQIINYTDRVYKGGKIAWNKGLTKETDGRVAKISESLKGRFGELNAFYGHHHTDETKAIISKYGGLRPGSGRGKKGWYKGYWCDSTYELVYVIYNIDHNIKFERCNFYYEYEYNGKIHKYFPDFILEDDSLVEIKGYKTELVDIKLSAVKDRSIKVLYKNDLDYAFDYVMKTYNVNKYTINTLYENTREVS